MRVIHAVRGPRVSKFLVCQEFPRAGLIWVRYIGGREVERSGGAFYDAMGAPWHADALIACVQGVRAKCSRVRMLIRGP